MRTKRSIKDSLKEYLNWCVGRLLLGGSRDDTVRDMVDAISDEIASGGGSGGESPVYYFPGDPSKLAITTPKADIPNILGPASEFMDAFTKGKIFISKQLTISGVTIPANMIYSGFQAVDSSNPNDYQFTLAGLLGGLAVTINIEFLNNDYEAISAYQMGNIPINTSGTQN